MIRIKKILSGVVVVAIFSFLGRNIYRNWEEVSGYEWRFNYVSLGLSFFFLVCTLFLTAVTWRLILSKLGGQLKLGQALKVWFYSSLGKYVPGKVWLVLGRVRLCEKEGLGRGNPFLSVGLEIALTVVSGLLLFLFSLIFWFQEELRGYLIFTFLLIPVGAILYPPLLNSVINLGLKLMKKDSIRLPIKYGEVLGLLALYLVIWIIHCVGFCFFVDSIYSISLDRVPIFSGIFAISVISGLLAVFAPAGLGIKEGVMASLLSLYMPISIATLIAILYRLWFIVVEMCCVGISTQFWQRLRRREGKCPTAS